MFYDSFFNNDWQESNGDFNTDNTQALVETHAKEINNIVQTLITKGLEITRTLHLNITNNNNLFFNSLTKATTNIKNSVITFTQKTNDALQNFYNHYSNIHNTTYKKDAAPLSNDIRIDYDGNAVVFIDTLMEAFEKFIEELNSYGLEMDNDLDSFYESIAEATNEFQKSTETALVNAENFLTQAGQTSQTLIMNANLTFKQNITISISNAISNAISNFANKVGSSGGDGGGVGGFISGLVKDVIDIGSWF
jgi:hypothetical protein